MDYDIGISQQLSLFQSSLNASNLDLNQVEQELDPNKMSSLYNLLKRERQEIRSSDKPLNQFSIHNKFRRIYQKEWHENYDPKESKNNKRNLH